MTASAPPVGWDLPRIMASLAKASWGDLGGREWQGVRTTLRALVDVLPWESGQGWTTQGQVALAAGLSERWVRRCMHALEDLDVITWRRGGVVDGQPSPSWVRISKRALVALIEAARPVKDAWEAARRTETIARLARLRSQYIKPRTRRNRRSAHAAPNAHPHPPTGEVRAPLSARPSSSPPSETDWRAVQGNAPMPEQLRAQIRRYRR